MRLAKRGIPCFRKFVPMPVPEVAGSPSMRTRKTSRRIVRVEPRTKMEKRKVLTGSAILYWGCKKRGEARLN